MISSRRVLSATLSLLCWSSLATTAPLIDFSKTKNEVNFLATGSPSALKIRGKLTDTKAVTGNITLNKGAISGAIQVQLEKLDTGIQLRNTHMKEKYLEIAKHPSAVLTLTNVAISETAGKGKQPFKGTLTLHGITQPVQGDLVLADLKAPAIEIYFSLVLSDFAIEVPKYLGITVSKTVSIEAVAK